MVGAAAAAAGKLTDRRVGRSCRLLSDPSCASTAEVTNGGRGVSMEAPVLVLMLHRQLFFATPEANSPIRNDGRSSFLWQLARRSGCPLAVGPACGNRAAPPY